MNPLLKEGLSDAIGFIGGALLGFWLGGCSGLTRFRRRLQQRASIGGILMVGVGGGLGLQLARRGAQPCRKGPMKSWLL
jgi:hypothetical protein